MKHMAVVDSNLSPYGGRFTPYAANFRGNLQS
jgi:hypothetical protein